VRRVFLRRVAISAFITFAALTAVAMTFSVYFELPVAWVFLFAAALTLGFVLEDVMHWRSVCTDRWQISDGMLIHDGDDGRAQIPLSEITSAKTQFGSRVIVKLTSGQRIPMRYLPYPAATAEQIIAARGPTLAYNPNSQ
jgi:hypothetical protein